MGIMHTVTETETLRRIANSYGVPAASIWDNPKNSRLRESRLPEQLCAGDRIWIPREREPAIQWTGSPVPVRTGRCYMFAAPQLHAIVCQFTDAENEPLRNWNCRTNYGGQWTNTPLDENGTLRLRLALSVQRIEVAYWPPDGDFTSAERRTMTVGGLDPISTISGVQARLANLGLYAGSIDGSISQLLADALRVFQSAHRLRVTGQTDAETQRCLEAVHDGR